MLTLGDNFSYQGAKPLDARLKYDTVAAMKAVGDSTMYEGCLAYCVATDKTYQWKSTNTVDTDLGKWREFSSGGGGGHAIEDSEGTALTQRETMQFGDGFNATDDSENEKTVVEPNLMTAADMDDVVTPLPSVQSRYHKYSTEEQIVGEWIDGKPIYEKTFQFTDFSSPTGTSDTDKAFMFPHNISNAERYLHLEGYLRQNNAVQTCRLIPSLLVFASYSSDFANAKKNSVYACVSDYGIETGIGLNLLANVSEVCITLQYTKTTS